MKNRTAFITGSSRGIGKAIALKLASQGCNIVVAAKTAEPHPKLAGTIYTAADEIEKAGGKMIRARKRIKNDGSKVYEISGPLFFGSVQNFMAKFDVKNDPQKIEIDFIESEVNDHSGIEAIDNVVKKYIKAGKKVRLTHLSPECKTLLLKADPSFNKIIQSSIDDPRYYVVTDLMDDEV